MAEAPSRSAGPFGARRRPVLLVPGWSDRARVLHHLVRRFHDAGWPRAAVAIADFRDRFGSNIAHAAEIAAAIDRLRTRTGADAVDVVAHSMGGLAVRHHLASHEDARIRRVVFLATPHAGTWAALLAWGGGRSEMIPGSAFLRDLPAPRVPCTTVRAALDLRVFPGSSARLANVPDVFLRHATHQGLLRSRAAFDAILAAFDATDPTPVA